MPSLDSMPMAYAPTPMEAAGAIGPRGMEGTGAAGAGADAAEDDDEEGEDRDVLAHADRGREDGGLHQAGEARQRRADAEHDGVEQLDVDAECCRHLAVG